MLELKNDRLIRALFRKPVDKTPVWIMRQAGRYLPEYRASRRKAPSFMDFCKNPQLACEVTLQPLARFDLDAAIIFSDILTVIDALGFNLEFVSGVGPVVHDPVQSAADLETIFAEEALEKLHYVYAAIKLTVRELDRKIPLLGFAGSPWTVACYLIDGQNHNNQFQTTRKMMYQDPELLHRVLQLLTKITIHYLDKQIEAGADAVMLFDSWGGILPAGLYSTFSLQYMQKIAAALHLKHAERKVPVIFFTKNGGLWLESIAEAGCDAISLDWTIDLGEARRRVGDRVALQGNLDPVVLLSTPTAVRSAVQKVFTSFGSGVGHVFNLGHGIDKNTPIENVAALIDSVREFGNPLLQQNHEIESC